MEKILKGYQFRLYPNEEQKILIEKSFGCSRYIYNYFLDKTITYKKSSRYRCCVKELLTTSDGTIVKNMKFIDKYEKKLKGLNKWLIVPKRE